MIRNEAAPAESYVRRTVCMVLAGTLLTSCTSSVFSNPSGAANDSTGFSVGISGDTAIVGVRGSGTNNAGKALVYQRSGTAWALQATLTSSTPSNEAAFGWSVGVSGDRAIVGALTDASLGYVSGAAYIFERNGGTWTQVARLVGDSAPETGLGQSVAISGDYAVVGAPLPPATTFTGPGHAFVYRRDQVSSWVLDATLSASDAVDFIEFGSSVSADGDKIVVGAKRGVVGGVVGGAAYVFRQSSGVWSQEAKLSASDAAYHDFFGTSVAVSADRILVGAKEDDDKGDGSGAAYVFERDVEQNLWLEVQKLTAPNGTEGDNFGLSVGLSGQRAIVGAWLADGAASTTGAAYVFRAAGSAFDPIDPIFRPDGVYGDGFGFSVAISGDCAVVGAVNDDVGGELNVGSASYYCGLPGAVTAKVVVDIICCVQVPDPAGPVIVTTRIVNSGATKAIGRRWVEAVGPDGASTVVIGPEALVIAGGTSASERLPFRPPSSLLGQRLELRLRWQDAGGVRTRRARFTQLPKVAPGRPAAGGDIRERRNR